MDSAEAGRALAQRHIADVDKADADKTGSGKVVIDRSRSLLEFSEVTGLGDWSLRSALSRLAQPEPARVGRLLESVRRLEAVLNHVRPSLERHGAICRRPGQGPGSGEEEGETYPDVRTADLARLIADGHDPNAVAAGYEQAEVEPLDDDERAALPLLVIAVQFEQLAATLADWANESRADRPVDDFDQACATIESSLDELEVPRESGRPGAGRGPGRSR